MPVMELVILSSSPPMARAPPGGNATPPSNQQRVAMDPLSPISSSPPDIVSRKPTGALRSGSKAQPVPEGTFAGFATAASLVRSNHFTLEVEERPQEEEIKQSRRYSYTDEEAGSKTPSKPRKRPTKATTKPTANKDGEPVAKKPRQRNPKTTTKAKPAETDKDLPTTSKHFEKGDKESHESEKPKAPKPRKPRAKKEADDAQTKLKRGKITKPRSNEHISKDLEISAVPRPQARSTGAVSTHFLQQAAATGTDRALGVTEDMQLRDPTISHDKGDSGAKAKNGKLKAIPRRQSASDLAKGLALDSAIARRTDWTPPRNTETAGLEQNSSGKENRPPPNQQDKPTFSNLFVSYSYAETSEATSATTSREAERDGGTKRRKIELVDIPGNPAPKSRDPSPEKKAKAPRKKARTITDLVTAQYGPQKIVTGPSPEVSAFFAPRKDVEPSEDNPMGPPKSIPKRSKTNAKTTHKADSKKKRKSTAKEKPKPVAIKLLTPESAALRINKQEILFGTSSQLEKEESPTFIRQLQSALRESEAEAALAGHLASPMKKSPEKPRLGKALSAIRASRGLWGAAARDLDDGLLEKDDLVFVPEKRFSTGLTGLDGAQDDYFADINDFPIVPEVADYTPPPRRTQVQVPSSPSPTPTIECPSSDLSFQDIAHYQQEPLPDIMSENISFHEIDEFTVNPSPPSKSHTMTSKPSPPPKRPPNTPAKDPPPKKRRGRPPKAASATTSATTKSATKSATAKSISKSASAPKPPSTPQRPSKFAHVDEISDSEAESPLSPTPPRIFRLNSSPLQLRLTQEEPPPPPPQPDAPTRVFKVKASELDWEGMKSTIFARIHDTVKGEPRTTDPQKPSWHEKILMYDPIVVEDFTASLNGKGIRAWKKATVKQVKEDAKTRKARGEAVGSGEGDEGMVHVVEKDLEGWMVQAWCQEVSVCCISREKIKGGPRRGMY